MPTEIPSRSFSAVNPQDKAEAFAEKRIEDLRKEISDWELVLENIRKSPARKNQEANDLPPVIAGQFQGMRMSAALEAYLKARPNRDIPIKRVVEDLKKGGAVLGAKPERYLQNLKITMQSRTKLVEWDKDWTMRLAPTAHEPGKPRNQKKA